MSRYNDAVKSLRRKVEGNDIELNDALDQVISENQLGLNEIAQLEKAAFNHYGGQGDED